MDFELYQHKCTEEEINKNNRLKQRYEEFINAIKEISDEDLMKDFEKRLKIHKNKNTAFKSIAPTINYLLKEKIKGISGWSAEVKIFKESSSDLKGKAWKLDFACEDGICVEVALNHGEAIAWNLLKPVLACEPNKIKKHVQGKIGVYVCATDKLKEAGNLDNACGSYEKVLTYLKPMAKHLTTPIIIIGLKKFESFEISWKAKEWPKISKK